MMISTPHRVGIARRLACGGGVGRVSCDCIMTEFCSFSANALRIGKEKMWRRSGPLLRELHSHAFVFFVAVGNWAVG